MAETTSLENITLTGGLSVSSSATQTLSTEHLKIKWETIALSDVANGRSSVTVDDVNADGALNVSSTGPADVSAQFGAGQRFLPQARRHQGLERGRKHEPGPDHAQRRADGHDHTAQDMTATSLSLNFTKIKMDVLGTGLQSCNRRI